MSLASQLARLEDQRRREISLLRERSEALAHGLEHDSAPGQWIRAHPYLATSAAALLGFTAAQVPLKRPSPPSEPPSSPPPAPPSSSSLYRDLLALLSLLHDLLQLPGKSPPTLTPDNDLTLSTPTFPHPVSPPPTNET